MEINKKIFRAYDIRGIVDQDLTEENTYYLGKAIGTLFHRKNLGKDLVISNDDRLSADKIMQALTKGLMETGINVIYGGKATSPMLYYAICHLKKSGGISITASHNPKDYNGFKINKANAVPITQTEIQELYNLINSEDFYIPEEKGTLENFDIYSIYKNNFTNTFQFKKKVKVVIDCANGVAGRYYPEIFEALNAEVIKLYCEPDGNFPNHEPDPSHPKNCTKLIEEVLKHEADFGLSFDGDGDRVGVVDNQGQYINCDIVLLLIAMNALKKKPNSKIICDIKCSSILDEVIPEHKGTLIRGKTGHTFIKKLIKDEKALLGGESSGHMFFTENCFGYDDACLAGIHILEILTNSQSTLSELVSKIPKRFNTPEIKVKCPDEEKFKVMEKIKSYYTEREKCSTIDGVKVFFNKDDWALLRCSNTTPYISMRFESNKENNLKDIQEKVFEHLETYQEIKRNN